jgi:AraC-like DNA-binding protein
MEEDLNLERMKLRIIRKCWFDISRFPTMDDVSRVTGLSQRTLHRYAKDNDLPSRTRGNIRRYILEKYSTLIN